MSVAGFFSHDYDGGMSLYAIMLDRPNAAAWKAIPQHWPIHLLADDRLALISAENAVTAKIAEQVGIGPDGAAGIVVQMNYYAGHTNSAVAEWVAKNRD